MKFIELKKYLTGEKLSTIYLLEGDDSFFIDKGVSIIKNRFPISLTDMNVVTFDAAKIDASVISAAVKNYPFMSDYRLVLIDNLYPLEAELKKLDCFTNIVETTIIIIRNRTTAKESGSSSAKENGNAQPKRSSAALKKLSGIVFFDCNHERREVTSRWIMGEVASRGLSISYVDAVKISDYSLCSMTKIKNEVDKLVDYCEGGEITTRDVDKLVAKDNEYKIYEMTDYIAKGNADMALSVLNDMLYKNEKPSALLQGVYNYFRRLFYVATSNMTNAELSDALGVKEFAIIKAREQAKKLPKMKLKNAVDYLSEQDYAFRCGKISVENALNNCVCSILSK